MTEKAGTVQSVGLATAIVVVANIMLYLVPLPVAFIIGGGLGEAARWYTDGGYFMHMVTLLAMAQLATGIVLGILHLHRPLPMVLYLIVPACTALIGIAGSAVGLTMVAEALVHAPPDMMLQMWSAGLAIAGVTRQFGLAAASLGCLSMVVGAGMAAFVRRGLGAPDRGTGAALITAGIGVAVTVAGTAGLLVLSGGDLGVGRPVVLVMAVLFGTLFAALGARGIAALASVENPAHQALAVSLGLTCALGLVLAVVSHGTAMAGATISSGLEAIATAPPDMRMAMLAAVATLHKWTLIMTAGLGLGALLIGATVLGSALPGFGPWVAQRAKWAGAAALLVLAVVAADALLTLAGNTRHDLLVEHLAVKLPDGTQLPASTSERRFMGDVPVVGMGRSGVTLDGETVGALSSSEARTALGRALAKDAPEEPNPVQKFLPSKGTHDALPEDGAINRGLLGVLAKPVTSGPCGHAAWGPVALALDGSLPAEKAWRQTGWLRDGGGCELQLLTEHDGTPTMSAEAETLLSGTGMLGNLVSIAANEKNALQVLLLPSYPITRSSHPPLNLTLTVTGGVVTIAGSGGTLDPPIDAKAGRVDQAALQKKLVEIKDAFPDERRVYLTYDGVGATTVQHLVDAMDAARDTRDNTGDTRTLFDDPVWIGSTRHHGSGILGLLGGPPPGLGGLGGLGTVGSGAFAGLSGHGIGTLGTRTPSGPVIMGALPKEVIQKVIADSKNKVRYCYEKALTRQPNLEGRIDLKFIINANGKVVKAQVESSTLGNVEVEKCILRAIKAMRFPKPAGGGIVEVRYPFIFKSMP